MFIDWINYYIIAKHNKMAPIKINKYCLLKYWPYEGPFRDRDVAKTLVKASRSGLVELLRRSYTQPNIKNALY